MRHISVAFLQKWLLIFHQPDLLVILYVSDGYFIIFLVPLLSLVLSVHFVTMCDVY